MERNKLRQKLGKGQGWTLGSLSPDAKGKYRVCYKVDKESKHPPALIQNNNGINELTFNCALPFNQTLLCPCTDISGTCDIYDYQTDKSYYACSLSDKCDKLRCSFNTLNK